MSRHTSTNTQTSQGAFWNSVEFAVRLRQERTRIGLNQKEFAALGGATLDSQSRYETGKNQPGAEYLAGLAANHVDVHYVLTGERIEGSLIGPGATELLDDYLVLSAEEQRLARALLRAVRDQSERPVPGRTLHSPQPAYRSEEAA